MTGLKADVEKLTNRVNDLEETARKRHEDINEFQGQFTKLEAMLKQTELNLDKSRAAEAITNRRNEQLVAVLVSNGIEVPPMPVDPIAAVTAKGTGPLVSAPTGEVAT